MRKSNWKLDQKSVGKMALSALLLAAGILLYYHRLYGQWRLSDACFLSGLFICCVGLFRVVRILGLLDLPIYGFKKLQDSFQARTKGESTVGSYADYQLTQKYEKSFTSPLLVGAVMIAVSLLLA